LSSSRLLIFLEGRQPGCRTAAARYDHAMAELLERASFLDELDALLVDADAGAGRLALIGGEAGIGKSVLVDAFCRDNKSGARVLTGACDALSTPRPLGPLVDIAREAGGELQRLLAAGAAREHIFGALLDELTRSAEPRLLLFEDIHWADEATFDLLRFLARRLGGIRALVVVTYRDDEIGPRHPLRLLLGDLATVRSVRRLTLPRLSETAVRTLAHDSAFDSGELHRRTGGNPFFVTEILAGGERGIPATVRDTVLARTARLPAPAREALEAAAVIGFRSEPWLLTELLDPCAAEAIDDCVGAGVLIAEPSAFAFRHELTREAVLGAISPPRRAALHRRVLEALRSPSVDPNGLARLAHHAEMAGDRLAVLAYAPAAARRAAEFKAHREAAAQYARALRWIGDGEPVERASMLEGLAYQCYLTDRHTEAVEAWTQALAIWRQAENRYKEGEILRWLSRPLWYLGRSPEAKESAIAALHVLESLPPGIELGWAYSDLSRLNMTAWQHDAALAWGSKAIALAERVGDAGLLAHALNNLGSAKLDMGDPSGTEDLERSLLVARAANLEEHAGRAYSNLASTAISAFQLARAEHWLEEGIAYALDHDVETYRLCMDCWRCLQLLFQGRWSEATESAAALLRQRDLTPLYRSQALVVLGRGRARRGDPEVGVVLDKALEASGPTVDPARRGPVRAARAEAAWLVGDRDRCADEAAVEYATAIDLNECWLVGELAYWLWRTGRLTTAPAIAAEPFALQIAGDWAAAAANWDALGCPYEAARARADSDDAVTLRRALAEFDRLGARPMAAAVARRLRDLGVRDIARGPRPTTRANPAHLTSREMETWRLLAEGLRNAEIADRLSVSTKTVNHHVSAVLAKLGVRSRTEAAHALAEHDLHLQSGKFADPK
jgi:DNA-binding CsgD family transcriptional regulator